MADQTQPPPATQSPNQTNEQHAPTTKIGQIELIERVIDGEVFYTFKDFDFARGDCDNKPERSSCRFGGTCIGGQCHWPNAALEAKGIVIPR